MTTTRLPVSLFALLLLSSSLDAAPRPRARDLGVPFDGTADTMKGIDGKTVIALPHDRLRSVLPKPGK